MIEDQIGIELHQRKFKGKKLTSQEREQLEAWYAQQDDAEASMLDLPTSVYTNEQLRSQISDILSQIKHITHQIQQIAQENDKIRQENSRLFQLLAQKLKAA